MTNTPRKKILIFNSIETAQMVLILKIQHLTDVLFYKQFHKPNSSTGTWVASKFPQNWTFLCYVLLTSEVWKLKRRTFGIKNDDERGRFWRKKRKEEKREKTWEKRDIFWPKSIDGSHYTALQQLYYN